MNREREENDAGRLVVVSNRVPDLTASKQKSRRGQPVGGLVTAVQPALRERGGIWFGWSGKTAPSQQAMLAKSVLKNNINLLTIDLTDTEVDNYYTGFSNRTLWPLFHSFPTRVTLKDEEYGSYIRVNKKFADSLYPYLMPGDIIWVQDYHLIPLAASLRQLGWNGPIGFFLHTPFPPPDIFWILPWARQLLEDFLSYDLVGFHIERFRKNFEESLQGELGGLLDDHQYKTCQGEFKVGVYPIGIDREWFQKAAESKRAVRQIHSIKSYVRNRRLILGVDRLDYTKGIVERLRAFERLLDRFPSWKRKVCMIQISAPSRTRIPEYISQKHEVDQLVGEINGRFGEADWTPISYLYRSYDQEVLAGFYRISDVCLVSPLRDGMNLVSKEYIASQDPENPGVLVLSRFCGSTDDLKESIVMNPFDIDGVARALKIALNMPLTDRRNRWISLMQRVGKNSARAWRDRFLFDLTAGKSKILQGDSRLDARLLDGIEIFPRERLTPDET